MAERKVFAGHAIRRLRRAKGQTQIAMAQTLGISASYLNLIERNQRPVTVRLMLALSEHYDFDLQSLTDETAAGGGVDAIRRRLDQPIFADLSIGRVDIEEWISASPATASAFARLADAGIAGASKPSAAPDPLKLVRKALEKWKNHFSDLDYRAEELTDELRLDSPDLYSAISERMRRSHQLTIRTIPANVMPDRLRRLDLHARQLQLSEMLEQSSRLFQLAYLLAQLEFRQDIHAVVTGTGFGDRAAERMMQRHLFGYVAAAIMMPYGRFLRACEQTGYDLLILQRRFAASFEQVAHRLTTLQRVGQRGLPFFMVRTDRAGQFSKRYAGASGTSLVEAESGCPLWHMHHCFSDSARGWVQLIESEDGVKWLTISQAVKGVAYGAHGASPEFAVCLGLEQRHAKTLSAARGLDLDQANPMPVGPGCRQCHRPDCLQRSAPPAGRPLIFHDRERGLTPFDFVND